MVSCLILMGSLLVGQVPAPDGGDLKAEVGRLVRRLDSPKLSEREAAEAELLRRGPAVLDVLPPVTDRAPAEVQERLGRIRQKLQTQAADAVVQASTITLHGNDMPIGKALDEFEKQSGNAIVCDRSLLAKQSVEAKLKVDFDKTPFWPAFDQVLDQAGLTFFSCSKQRALGVAAALNGRPIERPGPASYSGPFRFQPVSVAERGTDPSGERSLLVTIAAAWEPRLRIISLMHRMADVHAVDDRDNPLPVVDAQVQQEVPVGGETGGVKLEVPLRPAKGQTRQIASLRGKLLATIAGKIETFRFGRLVGAKTVEQRMAGVTVTVDAVQRAANGGRGDKTNWEVRMRARFDDAGDALASHRTWIFDNEAYLQTPDEKRIAYDSFETTVQSKNEVGVAYLFKVDRPISELTFVYKTPGTIINRDFDYELRDIKLP